MTYNYSNISLNEFPNEVSLVLYSGSCSLRCPWCFNPELLKKEPLSYKQAKDAIDEHKDFITAVTLTGGEPLMNPFLFKIIDYIKDNGLKVKLNTNGFIYRKPRYITGRCNNWGLSVDYLHISLKGPNLYGIIPENVESFWGNGKIIEYSFIYSSTLWPDKYITKYAEDISKKINNNWFFSPDIFTITQFRPGDCLDSDFNTCKVPDREECINALKKFRMFPARRFMIETHEFGKEEIHGKVFK